MPWNFALFGTVLSNRIAHYIKSGLTQLAITNPASLASADPKIIRQVTNNSAALKSLPAPVRDSILHSFVLSFHVVFYSAAPVIAVGFLLALFLKELTLRTGVEHHAAMTEAAGEAVG
jgi:hypothetical protein